jgi:hypothetical protein
MIGSVAKSVDRAYLGSGSLKVNCSGRGLSEVSVPTPGVPAGKTISFHVWIPSGSNIISVQPYLMHGSAWSWVGNYKAIAGLSTGSWNTITLALPASAGTVQELGVELDTTSTSWTGALYIDSVTW